MNWFTLFMARRMATGTTRGVSATIIRLAIVSVALGIAVMLVSMAILSGFKHEIQEKITAYTGHIRITGFTGNESYEATPVAVKQKFYPWPATLPPVRHIQQFATKAGIVKTESQIQGVVFKGVASDFDTLFFHGKLVAGRCLKISDTITSNEAMISASLARDLGFHVGDPLRMWFITGKELTPRGRKLTVCGIFDTGLEEFDNLYLFGDLSHIRRLNNWDEDQTGGFEIFLNDFDQVDDYGQKLYQLTDFDLDVKTIRQLYPQIFDWLELQNINVAVILSLMVMVASIALVSVLLVLILEQTVFIGILKAMGATSGRIRQIFLIQASNIALKGMLWGNLLAGSLLFIQLHWKIFRLPQEAYYVTHVPVLIKWSDVIMVNAGAFAVCLIILTLPAILIARVSPVKAIRFS